MKKTTEVKNIKLVEKGTHMGLFINNERVWGKPFGSSVDGAFALQNARTVMASTLLRYKSGLLTEEEVADVFFSL